MKKRVLISFLSFFCMANLLAQDPWNITARDIDPNNYFGITTANGMLGFVSSPHPFSTSQMVLAGTYDMYGRGRVSNFLSSYNMLNMKFAINGTTISSKNITNFVQTLNMREGKHTSSFTFRNEAKVEYSYIALRQLPFSGMLDITIEPLKDITITATNILETPDAFRDAKNYYNEVVSDHVYMHLSSSLAGSPTGKLNICASSTYIFPDKRSDEPQVFHRTLHNNNHMMSFDKQLKAGQKYTFSVVGTAMTSAFHPDPLNEAERLTIFAFLEGRERLLERHNKAWDKLWESDIVIDGDAMAQQDIRSMLYHLYSFTREGSRLSISPMGLSGLGYNGHVFWDADTWIFPALLVLHPEMAKSMVDYRYDRLEAARKNAFAHGYKGAMFPWESSDSGFEDTPIWALSGPFEHHISGCVAMAAWNYYMVTQDKEWLREEGAPIILSTAEFWLDRVERNKDGKYEILNVVGSDEWAENVDNDAYTNGVAIANLEAAIAVSRLLGTKVDPRWKEVADNIVIHAMENGVTCEHRTYKGEGIKQADVNLLAYPLKVVSDKGQIKKDLAYYEVRVPTKKTPAMTQSIFSLLYARLGDRDKAYHFFNDAYVPNLNPPFRVIAEEKGGKNPYFITGAGGVLQAVLFGFGGLDITEDGVVQSGGLLPKHWKSMTLKGIGPDKQSYVIKNGK